MDKNNKLEIEILTTYIKTKIDADLDEESIKKEIDDIDKEAEVTDKLHEEIIEKLNTMIEEINDAIEIKEKEYINLYDKESDYIKNTLEELELELGSEEDDIHERVKGYIHKGVYA